MGISLDLQANVLRYMYVHISSGNEHVVEYALTYSIFHA
jgi:hypothetical protein